MKNNLNYYRFLWAVLIFSILQSLLMGCVLETPKKPYIIIEKSYGHVSNSDTEQWRYIYVGENYVRGQVCELTDKYNIGDTIK